MDWLKEKKDFLFLARIKQRHSNKYPNNYYMEGVNNENINTIVIVISHNINL